MTEPAVHSLLVEHWKRHMGADTQLFVTRSHVVHASGRAAAQSLSDVQYLKQFSFAETSDRATHRAAMHSRGSRRLFMLDLPGCAANALPSKNQNSAVALRDQKHRTGVQN